MHYFNKVLRFSMGNTLQLQINAALVLFSFGFRVILCDHRFVVESPISLRNFFLFLKMLEDKGTGLG